MPGATSTASSCGAANAFCRATLLLFVLMKGSCEGATVTHPDLPRECLQDNLLFDTDAHKEKYEYVCCDNSRYAEHYGFLDKVEFFKQIEGMPLPITFYDAYCGIPLYQAPIGRSFEDWKEESLDHGWPSFRDTETVAANVVEIAGHGELLSTCGTHLGHNLPDGEGNRHCINLICIAGHMDPNGGANSTVPLTLGRATQIEGKGHNGGESETADGDTTPSTDKAPRRILTRLVGGPLVMLALLGVAMS